MRSKQAFVGFHEGAINFPPTFKYDVVPSKRHKSRVEQRKQEGVMISQQTGTEEKRSLNVADEDFEEDLDGGEATSVASSAWTSVRSKRRAGEQDDDGYFHFNPPTTTTLSRSKFLLPASLQNAKQKWISLISSKQVEATLNSFQELPVSRSTDVISPALLDPNDALRVPPKILVGSVIHSDEEQESNSRGMYDSSSKRRVPSW